MVHQTGRIRDATGYGYRTDSAHHRCFLPGHLPFIRRWLTTRKARSGIGQKLSRQPAKGMTNWRALASARGLAFSEADLDRIVPILESLDSALRVLATTLDYTTEPALVLSNLAVQGEVSGE